MSLLWGFVGSHDDTHMVVGGLIVTHHVLACLRVITACLACGSGVESLSHLLFDCPASSVQRNEMFDELGLCKVALESCVMCCACRPMQSRCCVRLMMSGAGLARPWYRDVGVSQSFLISDQGGSLEGLVYMQHLQTQWSCFLLPPFSKQRGLCVVSFFNDHMMQMK